MKADPSPFYAVIQVKLLHLAAAGKALKLRQADASNELLLIQENIISTSRMIIKNRKMIEPFIKVDGPGNIQIVRLQIYPNQRSPFLFRPSHPTYGVISGGITKPA